MTFITCIDVLWEAIQQLHRVFFSNNNIPFSEDNSVFKHKIFTATDNNYFETIRACFAAHPINLNDNFSGDGKDERRYASWSGGWFGKGDFSVILYSNQLNKDNLFLDIYFDELLEFANIRYNYLQALMEQIDREVEKYFASWRYQIIMRSNDPEEQIEILIKENKQRLDNTYYNYVLEKLRIIFTTSITNSKNLTPVNRYKAALLGTIEELFTLLQQMIISELSIVDDSPPSDCQFAFSKLCEATYGSDNAVFIDREKFKTHLGNIVDFSECQTLNELYVIISAGFFVLNTSEHDSDGTASNTLA